MNRNQIEVIEFLATSPLASVLKKAASTEDNGFMVVVNDMDYGQKMIGLYSSINDAMVTGDCPLKEGQVCFTREDWAGVMDIVEMMKI